MRTKSIIITVAVQLCIVTGCFAQDRSPLRFREIQWDFGTIAEDGGPVVHDFGFVNDGESPIAIERVNASCGCTTPQYPRSVIMPGEEDVIKVSFAPMGYPGPFSKSVVVVTGGGQNRDVLTITGHVTPRVKTVEEEYPYQLAPGLRIDNTVLSFRQLSQGESSSMAIAFVNPSEESIELEMEFIEQSGLLSIHAPATVCGGCKGNITFTYDLAESTGNYGMFYDLVQINVDGHPASRTVYASMIGVDDFSGQTIETSPRLALSSQSHNFGDIRRRVTPYVKRLTIINEGEDNLIIRSISARPGLKTSLRDGMTIAPGASLPFEIMLYADNYEPGELYESIILTVNDPVRPVREIRVAAKIK